MRYVTETKFFRSVSVFFSDSEDEPADPNIIYEEPDDEASSSEKDVSDATLPAHFIYIFFFSGSVRRDKRERLSISPKQIPPPMLPRSAYRGIEREDPGLEQIGLGYRAVSAVGGDRGRARTVHSRGMRKSLLGTFTPLYSKYASLGALRSAAQMVSYEVSIGLILIVRLVSAFGSAKAIARMFP